VLSKIRLTTTKDATKSEITGHLACSSRLKEQYGGYVITIVLGEKGGFITSPVLTSNGSRSSSLATGLDLDEVSSPNLAFNMPLMFSNRNISVQSKNTVREGS